MLSRINSSRSQRTPVSRIIGGLSVAVLLTAGTAGCDNGVQGGLSGAAFGALAGMGLGSLGGNMGAGAAAGAIIGAVGGAIIGDQNRRNSGGSSGY